MGTVFWVVLLSLCGVCFIAYKLSLFKRVLIHAVKRLLNRFSTPELQYNARKLTVEYEPDGNEIICNLYCCLSTH